MDPNRVGKREEDRANGVFPRGGGGVDEAGGGKRERRGKEGPYVFENSMCLLGETTSAPGISRVGRSCHGCRRRNRTTTSEASRKRQKSGL